MSIVITYTTINMAGHLPIEKKKEHFELLEIIMTECNFKDLEYFERCYVKNFYVQRLPTEEYQMEHGETHVIAVVIDNDILEFHLDDKNTILQIYYVA